MSNHDGKDGWQGTQSTLAHRSRHRQKKKDVKKDSTRRVEGKKEGE